MSFTVMGDAVNLASRLEAVNKIYGTRILIAQATADALGSALELREIDRLAVVGQSVPQTIFEVMAEAANCTPQQRATAHPLRRGARRLPRRPLGRGARRLQCSAGIFPGDGPSRAMLARIAHLAANPPAADWDGSWQMEHK